jgi:hypothetical protein
MTALQLIACRQCFMNSIIRGMVGDEVLVSGQRPVELHEGILRKDGVLTYRSFMIRNRDRTFPPFPAH